MSLALSLYKGLANSDLITIKRYLFYKIGHCHPNIEISIDEIFYFEKFLKLLVEGKMDGWMFSTYPCN